MKNLLFFLVLLGALPLRAQKLDFDALADKYRRQDGIVIVDMNTATISRMFVEKAASVDIDSVEDAIHVELMRSLVSQVENFTIVSMLDPGVAFFGLEAAEQPQSAALQKTYDAFSDDVTRVCAGARYRLLGELQLEGRPASFYFAGDGTCSELLVVARVTFEGVRTLAAVLVRGTFSEATCEALVRILERQSGGQTAEKE